MIKQSTIDQILNTVRVDDVVGEFVSLKKRGVNYIACCPFHNEKTPSFTVSPTKGLYKCFGCGKAGNSVHFIMEHESMSYPEALRFLAQKYNIEIEEDFYKAYDDDEKNFRNLKYFRTDVRNVNMTNASLILSIFFFLKYFFLKYLFFISRI